MPLPSDTFLVAEEVPGLVHSEDQSDHLNTHGYWPSFNEIYYPQTRKIAGAMGDYKEAVRYKLFAEMQARAAAATAAAAAAARA